MTVPTTTTMGAPRRHDDEPVAVLRRLRTADEGTFSTLKIGRLRILTAESPWRDNAFGFSCIPPGRYYCRLCESETREKHCQVLNMPGRTRILIHAGHWCGDESRGYRSDVRGSILPAMAVGELVGQMAALDSRAALAHLVHAAPYGLTLEITDGTMGLQAGGSWEEEQAP